MPLHEFVCRRCDHTIEINVQIGETVPHPNCPECRTRCAKNYRISTGHVEIDVMSPSTGYHSSTRSYEDSLKQLTEDSVNRTGFETEIVRAEPNDAQSRPVDS
jgi:putative FmdB family regulatory protein